MNTRQRSLMLGVGVCLLVAVAVCWLLATGTSVQADPPGSEYQFLIGTNVNDALPFGFPDTYTTAADGSILILSGGGTFTLGPGRSISGGGTCTLISPGGDEMPGTWEATQLESFQSYGSSPPDLELGEGFEAGRMNAKIEVEGMGAARLTVWCKLPGVKIPEPVPEGIRVDLGDLHFVDGSDTDATLFIRESD